MRAGPPSRGSAKSLGRDAAAGGVPVMGGRCAGTALVRDHGGSHTCEVTAEEPCPPRHHHRLTLPLAILLTSLTSPKTPATSRRVCWPCWAGSLPPGHAGGGTAGWA